LLRAGSEVTALPAPAVDVADSTGAGDAFNGALAVALSRSWPPDRAARYAISAAALSVTRREVIASLPTEAEVAAVHDTAGSMR
jgi:ribokinase